jgi:hypothetical protein
MSFNTPPLRRRSAIEGLAEELERTNGSLNPTVDGLLLRITGGAHTPWDMTRTWYGREISGYTVRKTLWSKSALIAFYSDVASVRFPAFTLQLALPLSDDDIKTAAESYMTILNMRKG